MKENASPAEQPQSPQSNQPPGSPQWRKISTDSVVSDGSNDVDVAHVFAADVGVSLQNETVDAIHYDDANQMLMVRRGPLLIPLSLLYHLPPDGNRWQVTKGGVVFAYDLAMDAPGHHEQLVSVGCSSNSPFSKLLKFKHCLCRCGRIRCRRGRG